MIKKKSNLKLVLGIANDYEALKPIGSDGDVTLYDKAIIGITNNGNLVYSTEKMIKIFCETNEISYEESKEFLEYNCFSAYIGDMTPVYVNEFV